MLCLIYVIFIVVALYYASHQTCPRMAATAAALRQIWSGGCQSCRNSEVSGLSGLDQPPGSGPRANNLREACVCDVCPCAAIDIIVRTTTPVACIFDEAVNILHHIYCHILRSIIETYEMFNRVLECRTACRHQAQIVDENQYDSSENFSFGIRRSSIISRRPSINLRETPHKSTASLRQQSSLKIKTQSFLRFLERKSDKEPEGKPVTGKMTLTEANGEIEPTIAVERTQNVATKEKGVDMRLDEQSLGTEEKGVETRRDAESVPSSSREGTSHFSDRSWRRQDEAKGYFQVSDGEKSNSSAASQTYCDRCKEAGKLCIPTCPRKPHP